MKEKDLESITRIHFDKEYEGEQLIQESYNSDESLEDEIAIYQKVFKEQKYQVVTKLPEKVLPKPLMLKVTELLGLNQKISMLLR